MKNKLLIFSVLLSIAGCSIVKKQSGNEEEEFLSSLLKLVEAKWFQGAKRFQLHTKNFEPIPHYFYDVNPEFDSNKKRTNFMITTPEGGRNIYDVDIVSGQYYNSGSFCTQKDQYGKYKEELKRPNFSVGHIPKVTDQLGLPQKVLVFANPGEFKRSYKTHYFSGRMIGAYREQICLDRACRSRDEWKSRLVFIIVHDSFKKASKIKNLDDLKKNVDWEYTKAILQNSFGHNKIGDIFYQRYKVGGEVELDRAIEYFQERSTFFTSSKIKKLRLSCYKLYDHIWNLLGEEKEQAKSLDEVKKKTLKREDDKFFHQHFVDIVKKYGKEYGTCAKYVYPASINFSSKRHWTFASLTAFTYLNNLGIYYSCNRNSWYYGTKTRRNLLDGCTERDIARAINKSVNILDKRAQGNNPSYRYIDYDSHRNGSHSKVYSWVPWYKSHQKCLEPNVREVEFLVLPKNMKWQNRAGRKFKRGYLGEIIY